VYLLDFCDILGLICDRIVIILSGGQHDVNQRNIPLKSGLSHLRACCKLLTVNIIGVSESLNCLKLFINNII